MPTQVEKWGFFELALQAQASGNPYLDVTLEADFKLQDRQFYVLGFYDGENTYKLRFMSDQEETWSYTTHSNLPALDGQQGEVICGAPSVNNHGPVRVADTTHFAYADGTHYIPVGTTCYVWNLQGNEIEERTLKTLEHVPFNKMRMSVFPKRYAFNNNEPPSYPFPGKVTREGLPAYLNDYRNQEPPDFWDFSQFNPEYFRHLEQRILDLGQRGIEADLILFHPYDFGAWGFDRIGGNIRPIS